MATWSRRTVRSVREEWVIPAAPPWGANLGDLESACADAAQTYREAHGVPEHEALPATALAFHPADDEIVISFTTEEPDRG